MNRRTALLTLSCFAALALPGIGRAQTLTTPSTTRGASRLAIDTPVELEVIEEISSRSREGSPVKLRVIQDVLDENGGVLIPRGAPASGTITEARRAGMFGKRGLLDFSVDATTSVDGQRVPLRASLSRQGSGRGTSIVDRIVLNQIRVFGKGKDITVQAGTRLRAYVNEEVYVVPGPPRRPGPAADAGSAAPAAEQQPADVTPGTEQRVIVLKNGDRISGVIEAVKDGVYTVRTSLGTLKIRAADVAQVLETPKELPPFNIFRG